MNKCTRCGKELFTPQTYSVTGKMFEPDGSYCNFDHRLCKDCYEAVGELFVKATPKSEGDKEKPSSFASDLGTKLGLAAMPLVGPAAGGKTPNVNVIVIVNK